MSDRRAAVLAALRGAAHGTTVNDLVAQMSLHPNTVREHLDGLVEAGLATREAPVAGARGRPAWRYRAVTPEERDVRIRDYVGLAGALARQVARSSATPEADAEAAGADWGAELTTDRGPARSAVAVRREVVGLLDELGFAPTTDRSAREVRLHQCPLLATAEQYPAVVCAVHRGLVRGATTSLGGDAAGVELYAFSEPGACLLDLGRAG